MEALIILPAHLAHSKALRVQTKKPKSGIASFFQNLFSKLRYINTFGDFIMKWLRDRLYSPLLKFGLKYKILTFSFFIVFMILTLASFQGGIIRGAFFPQIASDQVRITLRMPNGTNEKVTDSVISFIENNAIDVTDMVSDEFLGENPDKH